jgi:hypothetical protein
VELPAAIQVWTDPVTNQSCFVSKHSSGVDLELRLYGFRVHSFAFTTIADAMRWANQWRPEGAPEVDAARLGEV